MMAPARVVLLGGTSEIGLAIVRELAARGGAREVVLAGRDPERLRGIARELHEDGCARAHVLAFGGPDAHAQLLRRARELLGGIDLVIVAVGALGERGGLPADVDAAVEVLEVNVVLAGSLLLHSARELHEQGHGRIAVLSSVAAQRPRASNAVYCAAKAGIDALARGLDDALRDSGVRVTVVRPGFVRTRMTRGLPVPPLACDAASVARVTVRGLQREMSIVWVPGVTRWVMAVLTLLPAPLFRRLPL
ncbi:MAG TPA: SDR family NAD(P)-dependent oxidoreductase [Solirubrobacteraceae bacterium]|nr:SDR family NAD(P)-dependent oxidoreductase [Solirubrobacteraceae bacterium]